MRDIYGSSPTGKKPSDAHPPAFATFEDGYRANCIVEAILDSAKQGQRLDEGELLGGTKERGERTRSEASEGRAERCRT